MSYKHPLSTIGTIIFFMGIFTRLDFFLCFVAAIVCWSIGSNLEKEYRWQQNQNPIIQTEPQPVAQTYYEPQKTYTSSAPVFSEPKYTEPTYTQKAPEKQYCVACGLEYPFSANYCSGCGKRSEHKLKHM
ncbi:MAG: hypothetical protein INQ03_10875 [Candidatus Heimdallarchaeota archaeon]|nr:hypothetical protein [Candidatus Heimdallarchaeota archaeon]